MLRAPSRSLQAITRLERGLTCAAFLILVGVIFADVLSREVFGTGLHWARQIGSYANLVVIMFGIGLASEHGAHLRPRFADGWLPQRWAPALDFLQHGFMALFCVAFAVFATVFVADSFSLQQRSAVLGIVIWPIQAVIPCAFFLAAIRHLAYAFWPELRPSPKAVLADESIASD